MSRQFWSETLAWQTVAPASIANTATETVIFPNVTIPANYLQDGRALRVRAIGSYSTQASVALAFGIRWGGVAGTVLCKTTPVTTPSSIQTAVWDMETIIQTRSNGANASVMANGIVTLFSATPGSVQGASASVSSLATPMTSGGITVPVTANIDTTADTALSVTTTWGTAHLGNIVQGLNYTIEALN